jgi:catechol 2,3-dioxygenase-like lactoylglutathione lyase family enzyme
MVRVGTEKESPMGKITVTRLYHIGIPVNDIKRAERFYVDVLGMKVRGRGSGVRESNRPFFELLGYWPENLRLLTARGDVEVVLFQRPKPIERDWTEDSFCHSAFSTSNEDFDLALEKMKEWGVRFHLGPIGYGQGRTLYFFDSEGNYLQLGALG